MIQIESFIKRFSTHFPEHTSLRPWEVTNGLSDILIQLIPTLADNFSIADNIAIHKNAVIEQNVVLKGPIIICENCFISANCYLRGGVFLDESVTLGPGCEIKQSIIFSGSAMAHFNYIGNSIVGSSVNFEAGAIVANHFNERSDKTVSVLYNSEITDTRVEKFGALIGDNSKIGGNAVLSPGTILAPNTIVKRLELVDQLKK